VRKRSVMKKSAPSMNGYAPSRINAPTVASCAIWHYTDVKR
jgi:hypothetical protein